MVVDVITALGPVDESLLAATEPTGEDYLVWQVSSGMFRMGAGMAIMDRSMVLLESALSGTSGAASREIADPNLARLVVLTLMPLPVVLLSKWYPVSTERAENLYSSRLHVALF